MAEENKLVRLEEFGFNKSCEWILHDESVLNFLTNVCEQLTDNIVLSEIEINEYEKLKEDFQALDANELDERLGRIHCDLPKIFEMNESYIGELESKVKSLRHKMNSLYNDIEEIEKSIVNVNKSIQSMERDILMNESTIFKLTQDTIAISRNFQEKQEDAQKQYESIRQHYVSLNDNEQKLFMHQCLNDKYVEIHDLIFYNINELLQDNFKSFEQYDIESCPEFENLILRLQKTMDKKLDLEAKIENANATIAELTGQIELFSSKENQRKNLQDYKKEIDVMREENEKIEADYSSASDELQFAMIAAKNYKKYLVLNTCLKKRQEILIKKFESLLFLENILLESLANGELLWVCFKLDVEKFQKFLFYGQEMLNEYKKTFERNQELREAYQSLKLSAFTETEKFMEKVEQVITKYANDVISKQKLFECNNKEETLPVTTVSELPLDCQQKQLEESIFKFKSIIQSLDLNLNFIANQSNNDKILEYLNKLSNTKSLLSELLISGPTLSPILVDVKYFKLICDNKSYILNIRQDNKKFQEIVKTFLEKFKVDKIWKNKQCLWIWFLTEPEKVARAIKDVREAAYESELTGAVVPLGGIRRK